MPLNRICNLATLAIAVISLCFCVHCSDDNSQTPANRSPEVPSSPVPADGATGQSLASQPSWWCTDPDGDSVFYDVYFGTEENPPVVTVSQVSTVYVPDALIGETVYYWKIVAKDRLGDSATSPTWQFSTGTGPNLTYPTAVGSQWEYAREITSFNFNPDSLTEQYGDSLSSSTVIEVVRTAILYDSVETCVFHESCDEHGTIIEADSYFAAEADGFYLHAYKNVGTVAPPKTGAGGGVHYSFGGRQYASIEDLVMSVKGRLMLSLSAPLGGGDSLYYEDPPVKCLQYPLSVGVQWTHRTEDNPWRIDKLAVNWQNVTVPLGSFECLLIHWLYDMDEDGEWDNDIEILDYLSAVGIVKRRILLRGIVITSYDDPNPIGTYDYKEEYRLTNYEVAE